MKTIEEILDEKSIQKWGLPFDYTASFGYASQIKELVIEVAIEHAKQCCNMQIKECAKNAKIRFGNLEETTPNSLYFFNMSNNNYVEPDIDSIVMTHNVAETK